MILNVFSYLEKIHFTKQSAEENRQKDKIQRKCSRSYTLGKNNVNNITVCKEYFLSMLGYKSNKVLTYLYSNNSPLKIAPQNDR